MCNYAWKEPHIRQWDNLDNLDVWLCLEGAHIRQWDNDWKSKGYEISHTDNWVPPQHVRRWRWVDWEIEMVDKVLW